MKIEVSTIFYHMAVEGKNVTVTVEIKTEPGYSCYVEMEVAINNLRICKFYQSEVPTLKVVQEHVEWVFTMVAIKGRV